MRKINLAIASVIITASVYAQTDTSTKKMFPPDLGKGSEQQTDKYNQEGGNTIENPNMKSDNDRKMNTMQDTTVNKKTKMIHPDGYMMMNGKMIDRKSVV